MEYTKTGVKGFDKFVEGGFPKGSTILVSGSPGTGKTIFGIEYLYNGATKFNEVGLYVSFEQRKNAIKEQARQFDWDFEKLEKQRKIIVWDLPATLIEKNTVDIIIKVIRDNDVKRVVIDSLSTIAFNTPTIRGEIRSMGDVAIKRFVYSFISKLKETGATILLISQNRSNGGLTIDGVSEFICDGIINLKFQPMGGKFSRSLIIQKMRRCKNDEDLHPIEISKKGIVVHSLE